MLRTLTCPQGHSFSIDDDSGEEFRCPECAVRVAVSESDSETHAAPKGLWGLMGKSDAGTPEATLTDAAPKGLWATMKRPPSDSDTTEVANDLPADDPAKPKGLWSLMRSEPAISSEAATETEATYSVAESAKPAGEVDHKEPAESDDDELEDELEVAPLDELPDEDDSAQPVVTQQDVAAAEAKPRELGPTVPTVRSRGATRAFVLGIVAVLVSGLALLPEFWLRIPSTLLGFLGLMLGILSYGEIRRSRGRQTGRGLAIGGMALGAAGMLLGPFVFSELGVAWRLKYGRKRTFDNLQEVGSAMNRHYKSNKQFPPGSTYRRDANGEDIALHNWQTMLLPYLGEDAAYDRLDLNQPYDEGNNAGVMKRSIPAFLASGTDASPLPNGFAVTHFVALGGQIDVDGVGRVSVGVMDRNSKLRHVDVPDGLGNTLAAGEIATNFPSWGAPGNYRMIGKGLNHGRDGFGNSDGTGAMFLMADGSVRFLSNKIDPQVLRALSTRNGGERVDTDLQP